MALYEELIVTDLVAKGPAKMKGTLAVTGAMTVTGATTQTGKLTLAVPLQLPTYTVSTKPAATAGQLAYFSNGAAGNPCVAFGNGTNWILLSDMSTSISAT